MTAIDAAIGRALLGLDKTLPRRYYDYAYGGWVIKKGVADASHPPTP